MTKTVTLRLKEEVYNLFIEAAQAENRPLSNLIETAAFMRLRDQQFVDEEEMNAILSDQDLLLRIKKGSRQARSRRGRFVD
jgi:uncharacterized protein (DUF1778 family)